MRAMLLFLQSVFALAATLGLFGVGVYAARRWGPPGLMKLNAGGPKRLAVVETLTLDPGRRLVLVRIDAEERLLLLGEGQVLSPLVRSPAS
jgi:flagellar protein FliO/FliZ